MQHRPFDSFPRTALRPYARAAAGIAVAWLSATALADGENAPAAVPSTDRALVVAEPGSKNTIDIHYAGDGTSTVRIDGQVLAFDARQTLRLEIRAGDGNDSITVTGDNGGANGPNLTIDAGEGNDTIIGGSANEIVHAGPGHDTIDTGPGNDEVYGEEGEDVISGGAGNDSLYGGPGDDVLSGGSGDDSLEGGAGGDTLDGGSGIDRLDGGAGRDTLFGGQGEGDVIEGTPLWDSMHEGGGASMRPAGLADR